MIKTETKKATIKKEITSVVVRCCQICGKDCRQPVSADWNSPLEDEDSVFIYRRHGSSYPEGDFRQLEFYIVCPDCWDTTLKDFFGSHDMEVQEKSWEDDSYLLGYYN